MAYIERIVMRSTGGGKVRLRAAPLPDYRDGRPYWAFKEWQRSEEPVDRVRDRLAPSCRVWYSPN